jgi:hypothetical protein
VSNSCLLICEPTPILDFSVKKKKELKSDNNVAMATDVGGGGDVGSKSTWLKPTDVEIQRTEERK